MENIQSALSCLSKMIYAPKETNGENGWSVTQEARSVLP
jgi:hypothetical protein